MNHYHHKMYQLYKSGLIKPEPYMKDNEMLKFNKTYYCSYKTFNSLIKIFNKHFYKINTPLGKLIYGE